MFVVATGMFRETTIMFVVATGMFRETTIMFVVATGMFPGNYHNVRGDYRNVRGGHRDVRSRRHCGGVLASLAFYLWIGFINITHLLDL